MADDALRIEHLKHDDIPAAHRLSTQAGWNQLPVDWRRLLDLWPDFCLCGRVGSQIVATGTLVCFEPAIEGQSKVGWIGMILVDQAHRSRGYGGAIFDAILEMARKNRVDVLGLDATEMGQPVYAKRQFTKVCAIERWLAQRPIDIGLADQWTEEKGRELQPLSAADWLEIAHLDSQAIGVNRQALLRHIAGEDQALACAARGQDGKIEAAGIAFPGRSACHIGPIIGRSDAAAKACAGWLLRNFARQSGGPALISIKPRRAQTLELAAMGFTPSRRLARMILSRRAAALSGYGELSGSGVYAIASFELG